MSRPRWPLRALIVLLSFLSLSQGVPLDTPRPGEDAEYPSKPDGHPFALQPRDTGNRIPRDYDIAVMKGKELRCAMTLDARLAQTCFKDQSKPITSRFDQYSQLEQYGWTHGYNILDRMGNMQGSLDWLFRELHVLGDPPGSDGHTVYVDLAHVKQYTQGNQKLKVSPRSILAVCASGPVLYSPAMLTVVRTAIGGILCQYLQCGRWGPDCRCLAKPSQHRKHTARV